MTDSLVLQADDSPFYFPEDFDTQDSLFEKLIKPFGCSVDGWEDSQRYAVGPPPFHLISDLLLYIRQLGLTLKGLDLETPPPANGDSITRTTEEESGIIAAARQLTALHFRPRQNISATEWAERPAEQWEPFIRFLTHLLRTKSLKKIDLSFYFMFSDDLQPLLSMAPPLQSFTWPNLEILRFNGPFHFEELQSIVKRLSQKVRLQWSGFLMSGSWAEVLEFLREQDLVGIEVGDVNQSVYGQECFEMTAAEQKAIFGQNLRWNIGSKATHYARGWRDSNPVKEWEDGSLVVSESEDLEADEDDG